MLHGMCIGNCVERQTLSRPISGTNTPQMLENEGFSFLWDFNVKCDRKVEARRPDIVFVNKQAKEAMIIDVGRRHSRGCTSKRPGAHLEPTTLLCSCNGVFTSKVIFRLNFPLIRLPQEPDDQLQEIKLTS